MEREGTANVDVRYLAYTLWDRVNAEPPLNFEIEETSITSNQSKEDMKKKKLKWLIEETEDDDEEAAVFEAVESLEDVLLERE